MAKQIVQELHQLPEGSQMVLLDVGANNAQWGKRVVDVCLSEAPRTRITHIVFEPNPRFLNAIHRLRKWSQQHQVYFSHVAAAAWVENTNVTFNVNAKNHETSSLLPAMATRYGAAQKISVPAIDLAAFLLDRLRLPVRRTTTSAPLPIVFLKMDVEGAEYSVLSRLLATSALCAVSHLHIEWHLNAVPPKERLAGLGLRLSLESMLNRGCEVPPRALANEESVNNNLEPVPGLRKELQKRDNWTANLENGSGRTRRWSSWKEEKATEIQQSETRARGVPH